MIFQSNKMNAEEKLRAENQRLKSVKHYLILFKLSKNSCVTMILGLLLSYHTRAQLKKRERELKQAHEALGKKILGFGICSNSRSVVDVI